MMKKLLLLVVILLVGCKEKKVNEKVIVAEKVNPVILKYEKAVKAESIGVSYDVFEYFDAHKLGLKWNIVTEQGDLQGYLTIELFMNENYFWHFPNEESRKWFVDFLNISWNKFKEWEATAKENNVLELDKTMLIDSHKYLVSKRFSNKLLFTDQMTISSRAHLMGPVRPGAELRNAMVIDFNKTMDFTNTFEIKPKYGVYIENEKVLNAILNLLQEERIKNFIIQENNKNDLFE